MTRQLRQARTPASSPRPTQVAEALHRLARSIDIPAPRREAFAPGVAAA